MKTTKKLKMLDKNDLEESKLDLNLHHVLRLTIRSQHIFTFMLQRLKFELLGVECY